MSIAIQIVLAYWLADAFGALYHLATDRGWNIASQCQLFQKHHEQPWTMTFDLSPMLIGIPLLACAWLGWFPVFFVAAGLFASFAQVPHYFTHFHAPAPIRWLQRAGLILSPEKHRRHHSGAFDSDFCVVSGWNDWWVNRVARWVGR